MTPPLRVAMVALPLLLLPGCTTVVPGAARPAPGLTPEPVTGASVRQALLDDVELSALLGQNFRSDPHLPPRFGGIDDLPDGWVSAAPRYCIGTVVGAQKTVYRALGPHDVQEVAQEFWGTAKAARSPLTGVAEGVIALPTAGDAQVAFEKFAAQWNRCAGITVTRDRDESTGAGATSAEITDVQTGDSVITATVRTVVAGAVRLSVTRAVGIRVNCLVDVDVFAGGPLPETADQPVAAEVARAMMDKVSALAP